TKMKKTSRRASSASGNGQRASFLTSSALTAASRRTTKPGCGAKSASASLKVNTKLATPTLDCEETNPCQQQFAQPAIKLPTGEISAARAWPICAVSVADA